ncbi:MAG TPA: cytochrome c biogenesis protein CcsA [Thermoanaerobaculia bacterium]|nr:cytochrome c biogenesis protein CcsA [Thermoanaerobaculia bacterium]
MTSQPSRAARALLAVAIIGGAAAVALSLYADAALHGGHKVGGVWLPFSAACLAILASALFMLVGESFPAAPPFILAGAVACLAAGSYLGLFVAPPEHFMGEVQRIMYVHVPTAWSALLALTFAFGCAIVSLFTGEWKWDAKLEAGVEVGVLLGFLLCCQGAIWAKPTWGVWWDWDPRLTTTAVLVCAFLGILALRHFVDDPVKRATWSAVATIIAYVDVPIVYYSVRWWNSLHQMQSSPETVSPQFYLPLRLNAFGVLFLMTGFIILRSRIAAARIATELAPPPPEFLGELA